MCPGLPVRWWSQTLRCSGQPWPAMAIATKNRPKSTPKSTQNRPQIDPDRPEIELGWVPGATWAPRWLREPTWPRKPANLTPWGPPSWEPKSTQNRQKIDPKFNKFLDHFFDWFWSPLGVDLVRFWGPKWSQNWSRIGLKSDHDIKTRVLVLTHKNQLFLHIFCHRGDRKSIKNRSKSHLKAVLSWDAERTRKNHPKWFQKWPNMEPNLAPLEDHLAPKSH